MTHPIDQWIQLQSRRQFVGQAARGLGGLALASLLGRDAAASLPGAGALRGGHFPARAKRVIWMFMAGAPSQLDTFDYKPQMDKWFDKDLPESVRKGQRLDHDDRFPSTVSDRAVDVSSSIRMASVAGRSASCCPKRGRCRTDVALIRTMWTEAINHDPAITFI